MSILSTTRGRPRRARAEAEASPALLSGAVVAAVATTLMLEAMRVFVSYLVFVIDQSRRTTLAEIVLAVFLSIALGGLLVRLAGPRWAMLATTVALVAARLMLQFWSMPQARLILGAAVVVAWGWLTIALLTSHRAAVALGLAAGLGLDLAIRVGFGTLDLPWTPGLAAHAVTIVLAVALLASALALARSDRAPTVGAALPLVAVGPALGLAHLVTGNIGLAQARLDVSFTSAALVLALGTILGLAGSALILPGRERRRALVLGGTAVTVALAATGLWLFWQVAALAPLGLVVVAAASLMLLTRALLGGRPGTRFPVASVTVWFTLGLILQVALLFAYYTYTGRTSLTWALLALLAAGSLAAGSHAPLSAPARLRARLQPAAAVALLLILAGPWLPGASSEPAAGAPLGPEITGMTYNIQSGFSVDNVWSLEATARVIETAQPDVVVLEEVSRGWLVTSTVDEVRWLSRRLDMPYVFGPNADDGLWGNAILTRAPITSAAVHHYSVTQNLKRSVVEVELATTGGSLWVFGTHLDDPRDADAVRLGQIRQLLGFWDGRAPALLLGDLNADPGTPVLTTLDAAGFHDLGAALGPAGTTSEDHRRIDYVLGTDQVHLQQIHIPDTWASDHRPVVARITISP